MSLDFDVSAIANHSVVTTDPNNNHKWHPVTTALIWACMAIDMPGIDEKNKDEFWTRLKLYEALTGTSLFLGGKDVFLTKADVEMHIGLRTNVSYKPRKAFYVRLETWLERYNPKQEQSAWDITKETNKSNIQVSK